MANTGFRINPTQEAQVITVDYANMSSFPITGNALLFYKDLSDGKVYQWQTSSYVEIDAGIDANGDLVEDSGLPQLTRSTPLTSAEYRVLNTTACPIDSGDEVALTVSASYNVSTQSFDFTGGLTAALDNDLTVSFINEYKESGLDRIGPGDTYTFIAGATTYSNSVYYPVSGVVTDDSITFVTVSPNPNGTKTIIY